MTASNQVAGKGQPDVPAALVGLRVLDLGGLKTAYCGRIFADFGAEVILVEPPGGDSTRRLPPFAGDQANMERSLVFLALHTNKLSIVLDLEEEDGRAELRRLARTADVVVEGFQPGYLDDIGLGFADLQRENPELIYCSITPFGQSGPFAGYKGLDLHAEAMGGLLMAQGDPGRQPCMSPAFLGYELPSIHGALGIFHALFARGTTGRGQHVDVSMQEVTANIALYNYIALYGRSASISERPGDTAYGGVSVFPCSDGHVMIAALNPKQYMALAEWVGDLALQDAVFEDRLTRQENAEFINTAIEAFTSKLTVAYVVEEAQRRRIPTAPMNTPGTLSRDPQFVAREFFVRGDHPVVGELEMAGAPGNLSETPWRFFRPAPLLGEHTDDLLASVQDTRRRGAARRSRRTSSLPLERVRMTDLTRALVGPYATRQLADFGAEVIKIESGLFDLQARTQITSPTQPEINRNKLSISVDLHTHDGQELVRRLIKVSDVVAENYSPGALQRWGLDYANVRQFKPEIVYLSISGFGQTGPFSSYVSWGRQATAAAGIVHLWGHADSPLSGNCGIDYADNFVGSLGATLLEIALYHRRLTGRGQYVEVSMTEGMASAAGIPFLDFSVNGRSGAASGNQRPYAVPHEVYPCKGEDAWCAIACTNDEEWAGLGRALTPVGGEPLPWTQDARFATLEGRLENRGEIDDQLSEWTRRLTPRQTMILLQNEGVPATAVQTNEDMFFDHHLRARNYIVPITHGDTRWGTIEHPGFTAQLSETPGRVRTGAPALGQHNRKVLGRLLGLTAADIRELQEAKVLA